jgi:hypothetical protein
MLLRKDIPLSDAIIAGIAAKTIRLRPFETVKGLTARRTHLAARAMQPIANDAVSGVQICVAVPLSIVF